MSLFKKIAQENEVNDDDALIHSVIDQLVILFSNRNDKYWIWDFKESKLIALHEIFKLDYASADFANALLKAIEAFDARVFDVNIALKAEETCYKIFVECKAVENNQEVKIPKLIFDL